MYAMQGKYSEAQLIYAHRVELEEKTFGKQSVVLANTLDAYAQTLRKLGQDVKAVGFEERAKTIRAALR